MVNKLITFLFFCFASSAFANDGTLNGSSAAEAYVKFWDAFESYENKKINEAVKNHAEAMTSLRSHYSQEKSQITKAQVTALQTSATKYKQQLKDHPSAPNRPFVLLNLAQVLSMIGDIMAKENINSGTFAKSEALEYLLDINARHSDFAQIEQANYLRATILETMDRSDDALIVWRALSNTASNTIFGVHASVASGDYFFRKERAAEAVPYYQKALVLLEKIDTKQKSYEAARINYRLAWSAYRAAEPTTALNAALSLFEPSMSASTLERRSRFQLDAIDIAADALYDLNNRQMSAKVIKRPDLNHVSSAIGERLMTNYLKNNITQEAIYLGDLLAGDFPLSAEIPKILALLANAHAIQKSRQFEINALEKIAMLLPAQSLYRSRHQKSPESIRAMEVEAKKASLKVADFYYDFGLSAGNIRAFSTAASYYDNLTNYAPNDPDSNKWRLRKGHCYYFAGRYNEADEIYTALKYDYKVDNEVLQVAGYQHVQTNEKRWRDAFSSAMEKGSAPLKDPGTLKALNDLEKSIDEFSARFPEEGRSIDLLLVGAGANRDMEQFERASRYWQRVLVSKPSDAQRGVAIRGMIFASMKIGTPYEVASITRKFLKLENWGSLGSRLEAELKSVLAESSIDEGKHQNQNGNALEAGIFMTSVAEEFPDLPRRARIYRDGAYLLAIGGEWSKAEDSAKKYLKSGLQLHKDDILYLLARAQEYQLKLKDAAQSYFDLAEKFPKHIKASNALKRSEDLAVAEHDFNLAANAAALQAERSAGSLRLANFKRAADYMEKSDDPDRARALAQKASMAAKTQAEKFNARLLVGKMLLAKGSTQDGIDNIRELSKQIMRSENLSQEERASLSGEVFFILGEDDMAKFNSYSLVDREGSTVDKIMTKERYYNDLKQEYSNAMESRHPEWSTRARYQLAIAAQSFADEISMLPSKSGEKITYRSSTQYQKTAKAFSDYARKLHSENVLEAAKNPATYRQNDWIRRSKIVINGGNYSEREELDQQELLPVSFKNNLPAEWSL
jgi:hypothetical protein